MFSFKMASKSRNISLILKKKINKFVLEYFSSLHVIIGSEHNGDALSKNYKPYNYEYIRRGKFDSRMA